MKTTGDETSMSNICIDEQGADVVARIVREINARADSRYAVTVANVATRDGRGNRHEHARMKVAFYFDWSRTGYVDVFWEDCMCSKCYDPIYHGTFATRSSEMQMLDSRRLRILDEHCDVEIEF